jgi:hypothetical protein
MDLAHPDSNPRLWELNQDPIIVYKSILAKHYLVHPRFYTLAVSPICIVNLLYTTLA